MEGAKVKGISCDAERGTQQKKTGQMPLVAKVVHALPDSLRKEINII